jgi:hypothetical protein
MALTQEELDQVVEYLHSITNEVMVNELPPYSDFGDLASDDIIMVKMLGSVNKTVYAPISALSALLAASATVSLDTPVLSLEVISDTQIDASWAAVTNATAYKLYRSETANFNDAELLYTGSGLLYNDTGRAEATTYYYWLQATASGYADSGYSTGNTTTTGAGADTTAPVLSTLEVSTTNSNQIILTYNETLQTVGSATTTQWTLTGKTCTFAAISGTTVTLTFNTSFVPGETPLLNYSGNQVKDTAGNLAATFTNQAVTNNLTVTATKLSTPLLVATVVSDSQINLTWSNVANEDGFEIEESSDGSSWSTLTSPSADVLAYNVTGLTDSTLCYFRIKAVGDGTNFTDSDWSTTAATTEPTGGLTYDTAIHLTGSWGQKGSAAGITAIKLDGSLASTENNHLYFNAITSRSGTPMSMKVTVSGSTTLYVDYPSDYAGQPFQYERDSVFYNNTFPMTTGQTVAF